MNEENSLNSLNLVYELRYLEESIQALENVCAIEDQSLNMAAISKALLDPSVSYTPYEGILRSFGENGEVLLNVISPETQRSRNPQMADSLLTDAKAKLAEHTERLEPLKLKVMQNLSISTLKAKHKEDVRVLYNSLIFDIPEFGLIEEERDQELTEYAQSGGAEWHNQVCDISKEFGTGVYTLTTVTSGRKIYVSKHGITVDFHGSIRAAGEVLERYLNSYSSVVNHYMYINDIHVDLHELGWYLVKQLKAVEEYDYEQENSLSDND
jgi:hypothetical protein